MSMYEWESGLPGEGTFETWETAGEYEDETSYELGLAQELLEITTETELDQFLGKLLKGAVKGVGRFMKSTAGRAIGGVLKSVAKTALPMVGAAVGSFVAPGAGTALGGQLGSMASKLLEVGEAETLGEQAELEAAYRYVRFARAAARNAARAPANIPGRDAARRAAIAAARQYAPALLRPSGTPIPARWRDRRSARYGYRPAPRRRAPWAPAGAIWPAWGTATDTSGWDQPMAGPPDADAGGWPNAWDGSSWDGGDAGDQFAGASYEANPGYEIM